MTRREELWREGSLSYAGAARMGVGDSQRYSRKSNEREPNEAILKGDIVGSLGRRTNSITSSGIERRERGSKRRGQERRGEREKERAGGTGRSCAHGGGRSARCTPCTGTEMDSIAGTDRSKYSTGFSPDRSITISLDYAFNIVASLRLSCIEQSETSSR